MSGEEVGWGDWSVAVCIHSDGIWRSCSDSKVVDGVDRATLCCYGGGERFQFVHVKNWPPPLLVSYPYFLVCFIASPPPTKAAPLPQRPHLPPSFLPSPTNTTKNLPPSKYATSRPLYSLVSIRISKRPSSLSQFPLKPPKHTNSPSPLTITYFTLPSPSAL